MEFIKAYWIWILLVLVISPFITSRWLKQAGKGECIDEQKNKEAYQVRGGRLRDSKGRFVKNI